MANVLILGAHGQIAQLATKQLLNETKHDLKLFLRRANRLNVTDAKRETVIDGDVLNAAQLDAALKGVDVVYANLAMPKLKTKPSRWWQPWIAPGSNA